MSSTSSKSSEHASLQDQDASSQSIPPPQRPRFLRAITSPLPSLKAFATQTSEDPTTSRPHQYSRNESPSSIDPQQPIESTHDNSFRSFSSTIFSSFLPSSPGSPLTASMSPTTPSQQPRASITETLKERRWSRGQILNWMPGFTKETHPSPITATDLSPRSLKSVQRHKSESVGLSSIADNQRVNSQDGYAVLGLDAISVSGNMCLDQNDQTINHLRVNEARSRRVSESGQGAPSQTKKLMTSSTSTSSGFAERLSGFNQNGRTRPTFMEGDKFQPIDQSTTDPRHAFFKHRSLSGGIPVKYPCMACLETEKAAAFNTWDDFLTPYSQGYFPNTQSEKHPETRLESEYPPMPDYSKEAGLKNPPPFLAAPIPPSEERRLKALYSYQIIDTGSDVNFQRIAQLVSTVLGVRGCMISLVDYQDVAIKAQYHAENMECRRELSFSGHTILRPTGDPLIVLDASKDWRFRNLPSVKGGSRIRFYAGAPLSTSDGLCIGSLCVTDPKPRAEFTETEKRLLNDFAAVVMREMELWNDQVQLCTRSRMMRDITRWVRGCLGKEQAPIASLSSPTEPDPITLDLRNTHLPSSPEASIADPPVYPVSPKITPGSVDPVRSSYGGPSTEPVLPTPTGSPTLLSVPLTPKPTQKLSVQTNEVYKDRLIDEAFPSACGMIQATMNIDAVYLVQTSFSRPLIPVGESNIVWNYLGAEDRTSGSTGTVGSGETLYDKSAWNLDCLASSEKPAGTVSSTPIIEHTHKTHNNGRSWLCTDEGCRPHRLGEFRPEAIKPHWERDMPIISEIIRYVRQEKPLPPTCPGKSPLFTCYQNIDEGLPESSTEYPALKSIIRKSFLCHTFQGTLHDLPAAQNSLYKSCVVMPIHGASTMSHSTIENEEPWAYFVALTSSHTKQFSVHERIYLRNFGSCLITEVLKRHVEAADKAKGIFIKSISHELRTPLHIILGILELLHSNENGNLSEQQLSLIASAEGSGKGLIDIINNIIDLADLDPDNAADSRDYHGSKGKLPELYSHVAEIDIRELCEQVAGTMAKSHADKNVIVVPWTKPPLGASLPLSSSAPAPPSFGAAASARIWNANQRRPSNQSSIDGSVNGDIPSMESQNGFSNMESQDDQKTDVELLVAVDEPEADANHETPWNFILNLQVTTRILTQLLENALKFTTTGFVEISAVSPPLSALPLKPPSPEARPILFTVRDTGKGISPDFVHAHLFQRFSQEDPLQVGTGLGLALVKLLVESLGGWLEIWSEGIEGKGCVVRVLIWATPCTNTTKSLKDEPGKWQEKSCRFYTGEPSVSTDRLWKIMGERMLSRDFNMNVHRGDEQDISPEDMLKDFNDKSKCDLIVLNDDFTRLKAYLSHWTDIALDAYTHGLIVSITPTPLLMLTPIPDVKNARCLVESYRKSWRECGSPGQPANVVIMSKPIGPLNLLHCLRACFSEGDENDHYSVHTTNDSEKIQHVPLIRSSTLPHISTMALGVQDTRRLSAGTMIKSSFKFPTTPTTITTLGEVNVPPHSPGGLALPNRSIASAIADNTASMTLNEEDLNAAKGLRGNTETKLKTTRSIKNFMSQRGGLSKSLGARKLSASSPSGASAIPQQYNSPINIEKPPMANTGVSPRVLIVEDNITNRMILRTFLRKQGIAVVEAENGKLGVERFQEEVWRRQGRSGFEFVLMDLQMPVMDGNLATKRIREFERSMAQQHGLTVPEPPSPNDGDSTLNYVPESESRGYQKTTIFALTGLAGDEDKRLAFECGVDGYLTKP
ncbi:His Kinase A domain containing protein [Entomortierella beljakovae]|nr:His Kinase A domain containing protein [Entomortierella beljakovae]